MTSQPIVSQTTVRVQLKFVRETGEYIIAKDDTGKERWFDRRKIISSVIGRGTVTVILDRKSWARRLASMSPKAPSSEKKDRKCLNCGHTFPAEKNIYICQPCKSTSAWKSGADYSVAI